MKKALLIGFAAFVSVGLFSQEYLKDLRAQYPKEQPVSYIQTNKVSTHEILRALEMAGIGIYKFELPKSNKTKEIRVTIDEYVNGRLESSTDLYNGKNTYTYYDGSVPQKDALAQTGYFRELTFYSKKTENKANITLSTLTFNSESVLKDIVPEDKEIHRFYNWRSYHSPKWIEDQKVPLLVYTASWHDDRTNVENFSGVSDLSLNDDATQELYVSSPHYFVISCTISD